MATALSNRFGQVSVDDRVCSTDFALVTISGGDAPAGESLVLLVADPGAGWTFAEVYPPEAAPETLPDRVPRSLVTEWNRQRQLRLDPPPPTSPTTEAPPATGPDSE